MKKLLFILIIALLAVPFLSFGQEKKTAAYFFADWCPHCQQVDKFFSENGLYDKYNIKKYDIDKGKNKQILTKIYISQGYSSYKGIPAIVIDDEVIVGDTLIIENFEEKIENSKGTALEFIDGVIKTEKKADISLSVLIGAALVDAINPCAFAVLILLVATVIGARGRKKALISGFLFAGTIFVSYFFMGLGLYKVITIFNLPRIISITVGILAILVGLANLKDAFWHGRGFLMEVPMSWRPRMKAILRGVISPLGSVVSALLISLFLLPCTSGPYVVILGLLAERVELAKTISLLALYNLIFVSPMIVITLLMYFGMRGKKLEELRQKNIRLLHGIAGAIMLAIGVYLISNWI